MDRGLILRRPSKTTVGMTLGAVLVAACLALVSLMREEGGLPQSAPTPIAAASGLQNPLGAGPHDTGVAVAGLARHEAASGAPGSQQSRPEILGRLVASEKPAGALEAYRIIAACVQAAENRRILSSVPMGSRSGDISSETAALDNAIHSSCEGIAPEQIRNRLDILGIAVSAGTPGAALAYVAEGPFGDPGALQTRADDESIRTWKRQAVELLEHSVLSGEIEVLAVLSEIYANGTLTARNPALSYTYQAAYVEALKSIGRDSRRQEEVAARIAEELPKAARDAAATDAMRLASACCSARHGNLPQHQLQNSNARTDTGTSHPPALLHHGPQRVIVAVGSAHRAISESKTEPVFKFSPGSSGNQFVR